MWLVVEHSGQRRRLAVVHDKAGTWVAWPGGSAHLAARVNSAKRPEASGDIVAPLTGKVIEVRARAGESVVADDVLVVLEAMKMEYRLYAPRVAVVDRVSCQAGERVDKGAVLVRLRP